ncbi:MAG: hypothetical protein AAGK03_03765 [Pseudomonadota bacterium]
MKINLRRPEPPSDMLVGTNENDEIISIPTEARAAHLHVIGRTRTGKSRFLADLISQDILGGRGVTLFDPHSELYDYLVQWLARRPMLAEHSNIHLVDFSDASSVFAFNPLKINQNEEAYGVAAVLTEGLSKVFGSPKATDTPLIDATLNTVFVLLAQHRLPVAAASYFLHERHSEIRAQLAEGHPNPYYQDLGRDLASRSGARFSDIMESSERRLRKLIGPERMRRVFSQTTDVIDFKRVMDQGETLLFNLRPRDKTMSRQGMQAIGTILLNTMFADAFTRDPFSKPTPHMFYIDEVQNYVNDDIEGILTEAAKVGMYLTLSHQTLGQLKQAGDAIYAAVMACTLLKAVMSVPHEDAMAFVDDLFGDQIDPERLKSNVLSPHVVGHRLEKFRNASEGGGRSDSWAEATSRSVSQGHSQSESYIDTDSWSETSSLSESSGTSFGESTGGNNVYQAETDEELHYGEAEGESSVSSESFSVSQASAVGGSTSHSNSASYSTNTTLGRSQSSGTTISRNWSEGWSESLMPEIEWLATQTRSIEDQRYEFAQQIARAKPRHGVFAVVNQGTISFKTRDVPDLAGRPDAVDKLLQTARLNSGSVRSVEDSDPEPEIVQVEKLLHDPDDFYD